jgi:hypothetical protein
MSSSMIYQFEHMTIADLRKLTEDYGNAQDIIQKQEDMIKKLKIKYPNKKVNCNNLGIDPWKDESSENILKECGVEVFG